LPPAKKDPVSLKLRSTGSTNKKRRNLNSCHLSRFQIRESVAHIHPKTGSYARIRPCIARERWTFRTSMAAIDNSPADLYTSRNRAISMSTKEEKDMNKADLINEVAKVVKTKKGAQEAVDCVLSTITDALKKGGAVSLVGFGTFKVADRKARKGRNPQTGEEIEIKARRVPRFVAGKGLKDAVK